VPKRMAHAGNGHARFYRQSTFPADTLRCNKSFRAASESTPYCLADFILYVRGS
jgi:hypothetical protein